MSTLKGQTPDRDSRYIDLPSVTVMNRAAKFESQFIAN